MLNKAGSFQEQPEAIVKSAPRAESSKNIACGANNLHEPGWEGLAFSPSSHNVVVLRTLALKAKG